MFKIIALCALVAIAAAGHVSVHQPLLSHGSPAISHQTVNQYHGHATPVVHHTPVVHSAPAIHLDHHSDHGLHSDQGLHSDHSLHSDHGLHIDALHLAHHGPAISHQSNSIPLHSDSHSHHSTTVVHSVPLSHGHDSHDLHEGFYHH